MNTLSFIVTAQSRIVLNGDDKKEVFCVAKLLIENYRCKIKDSFLSKTNIKQTI